MILNETILSSKTCTHIIVVLKSLSDLVPSEILTEPENIDLNNDIITIITTHQRKIRAIVGHERSMYEKDINRILNYKGKP